MTQIGNPEKEITFIPDEESIPSRIREPLEIPEIPFEIPVEDPVLVPA